MIQKLNTNMTSAEKIATQNANNAFLQSIALPIGSVIGFFGNSIPQNTLLCNGQAISRTEYAALFAIIGTTYGAGDGVTSFNVPNCQGYMLVGKNPHDTDFNTLGKKGGAKTHTQTISEMPAHNHDIKFAKGATGIANNVGRPPMSNTMSEEYINDGTVVSKGGGNPMSIMNPYITCNFIIVATAAVSGN